MQNHSPTIAQLALGFVSFHALHLSIISTICVLLYAAAHFRQLFVFTTVLYLTMVWLRPHELKDGNPWRGFSKNFPLFRYMRNMLGLQFGDPLPKELVDAEKKPDAQFVIALFPHGISADHRILMEGILDQALPNVAEKCRSLAATVLFRIPLAREIALWTGCVDARRSVAQQLLKEKRTILVMPGGEAEQIRTVRGKEMVFLKSRKGFIKLAMRQGVPVVLSYAFGVTDHYRTSRAMFNARNWLVQNLKVCIPLASGLWGSPVCPLPVKTTIVFGKPMLFQAKEKGSPSQEELDVAHDQFCTALRELFDEHKERLGYGGRTLTIF